MVAGVGATPVGGSRRLSAAPDGKAPKGPKRQRGAPGGFRRRKTALDAGPRAASAVPGPARPQEAPGGSKKPQEAPAVVERLQKAAQEPQEARQLPIDAIRRVRHAGAPRGSPALY